jgi:hypothetical protein
MSQRFEFYSATEIEVGINTIDVTDVDPDQPCIILGDPNSSALAVVGTPKELRQFVGRLARVVGQELGSPVVEHGVDR